MHVFVYFRELDSFLVEQCTVDTDTTTGQSVQAAIGKYRKSAHTVCPLLLNGDTCEGITLLWTADWFLQCQE